MDWLLNHRLLSLPLIIWGLQLLYVAAALGLFAVLWAKSGRASHLRVQILYVLAMLVINIIWRVALKKLKPGWY